MPRWTDQPATDTDAVFDFILKFSGTFLRRHASLLAKGLPPTLGFGMFLAISRVITSIPASISSNSRRCCWPLPVWGS
ncbi:hypothetical protein ABIC11_003210 [Pseudomonas oryzihabitans]|uniref:Uncharacterized protein n=1 Tax=Pseudomonas flavocrustae TaxID=2991719 RepID=A0ABT6IAS8_9PSED|nr:hypothetical protein [Pseudomonas sp. CBMAI 2609]MDH4761612.1 hypothetical protein [Pseudomonas sp. CBMAI 2609]